MTDNDLVDAMAAAVREYVDAATEPLVARIKTLEAELATRPTAEAHAAIVARAAIDAASAAKPADGKSVTLDEVRPLVKQAAAELAPPAVDLDAIVERVLAKIPKPEPGKDAIVDYDRIGDVIVLGVAKEVAKEVAKIPPPAPGKDAAPVDYALVKEFAQAAAVNAVAALPKPANGKDADAALVEPIVAKAVAERLDPALAAIGSLDAAVKRLDAQPKFDPTALPKALEVSDVEAIALRVATDRFAAIPKGLDASGVLEIVRERRAELMPEPIDAKAFVTRDEIEAIVSPMLDAAIKALPQPAAAVVDPESIREEVARQLAEIPPAEPGKPGKDADMNEVAALVTTEVARRVAEIPAPKDGSSVTLDDVRPMIADEVGRALATLPKPEGVHPDTLKVLVSEVVDKRLGEIRLPEDGKPGRDALDLEILESIDVGKSYPPGTFALHAGGMVLAVRDTDPIESGSLEEAGWKVTQDGIAGVFREESDDERVTRVVVATTSGKRFAVDCITASGVQDKGVHRPGMKYRRSDCVTFDESYWIAKRDTQTSPPGDDWRLILKGKKR